MIKLVSGTVAAFILALTPVPLAAHGDEEHGEKTEQVSSAEEMEAKPLSRSEEAELPTAGQETAFSPVAALKNLHPAAVHFPIGLLVTAALLELIAWRRRSAMLEQVVGVMVAAGAVGALVAAVLGWVHTGLWTGGEATMQVHRWLGSALAILAPVLWLCSNREGGRTLFRTLLFLTAAALLWQGFHGGELAHGAGHLWK